MRKITVEEIDILVEANIQGALKEFKKLVPEIKRQVDSIKNQFNNLDVGEVGKSIQNVKKQIKDTFNPDEMDEGFMKKIDVIKTTIKGVSSEYSRLSKVAKQANIDMQKSSSKVGFAKYDTGAILNYINNYNPKDKSSSGPKDFLTKDSNQEMRTKSKYSKYVGYFKE